MVGSEPVAVVIVRIPLIEMVRLPEAVWPGVVESVTVTVKLNGDPVTVVGEPEIVPAELNVRPGGRLPDVTVQVYGAVPPDALKVVAG